MGKGIGYNRSVGEELNPSDIKKIFVLADEEVKKSIIKLAEEIDAIYFELSKAIITEAKDSYGMRLMNHIYLSLTDHIAFAVKRYQLGIPIENFYVKDMRVFNPDEFAIGEFGVNLINRKLKLNLPVEEAGNLAFHFINAKLNYKNIKSESVNTLVTDLLDIIKYHFSIVYDEQSETYIRFLSHMKAFGQRLVQGKLDGRDVAVLFSATKDNCADEYQCVKKINDYIQKKYDLAISKSEEFYLMVHIHVLLVELGKH